MRPGVWIVTLFVLSFWMAGCAPQPTTQGNDTVVMFDGLTQVYDEGVYDEGKRIGQIQNTTVGIGNLTKMTIRLAPEAVQALSDATVFYIHMGRLEAVRLQRLGAPRELGEPMCGFTSKAELNWFKLKTLLRDRVAVARQRAMALQVRFG